MASTLKCIIAEPLTAQNWAPFGWVPVADTDPSDGRSRLEFEWNDVHVNVIHHDRSEVPKTEHGLVCEMMFHHKTHTQALLVLNCRAILAVAPPGTEFSGAGDASSIHAFVLDPGESLVLHRGTWHWGPFPIEADRVDMYNVQGLRYAEDNNRVDLAAIGAASEVVAREST